MTLRLRNKYDRQLWQYLSPNQREFAKSGKCINLTADYLPEDIPTRFVFVCLNKMIWEYVEQEGFEFEEKVAFDNYLKLFFEDGVFKGTIRNIGSSNCSRFNLPSAVIRTKFYKNLPKKYQELILGKLDMNFPYIGKYTIC